MSKSLQMPIAYKTLFQNIAHGTSNIFNKALYSGEIDTDSINIKFGRFHVQRNNNVSCFLTTTETILTNNEVIIQLDDLPRYNKALYNIIQQSKSLRDYQRKIKNVNAIILQYLQKTKIVYRGIGLDELIAIVQSRGRVGAHNRLKYAAKMDFVSCSVDRDVADDYASRRKGSMILEIDISGLNPTEYAPVKYELMQYMMVFNPHGIDYNPFEQFENGRDTSRNVQDVEIHLKQYAQPIIKSVSLYPDDLSIKSEQKVLETIKNLESIYNKKIIVEYI